MADPYAGFATLGDMIGGGPGRRAEANYPQYLAQAASGYKALDQAAEERAKRLARDVVGEKYRAWAASQGLSPEAADLGATYATGGDMNFNTQLGGTSKLADMEMDRQITQALATGDVAQAQRLSAVKTDKVLPTLGAGGKVVFTPVTGDATMTGLGDAAIGAEQALVGQREASTDAAHARAERARRPAAAPQPHRMPVAELKFHAERIEQDLGRKLTDAELQQLAAGTLDIQAPADSLGGAAPRAGYTSFDDIPAEAKSKLKAGKKTTFANGQVWTLVDGQPTRVK